MSSTNTQSSTHIKNRDSQNPNGTSTAQIGDPKRSKKLQKAPKCSLDSETITGVLCVRGRTGESVFQSNSIRGMLFHLFHFPLFLWRDTKTMRKKTTPVDPHLDFVSPYH
jgi:hypothetical protein